MPDIPPTNGELLSRVVALESGFAAYKDLMEERDRRYKERSASQDNAVKSAQDTSEKAIIKANDATEKRFDSVNEFRNTLSDQAATFMPRPEYTVQHQSLLDKMQGIEVRLNNLQQEISAIMARGGGVKETWGYIIAIAAIVVAGFVEFFHH